MRLVYFVFALCFLQLVHAQSTCSCEDELNFVMDYYEKNLASFSDNVSDKNRTEYESFKRDLRQEVKSVSHVADCFKVLTYYVEFFKDNHASIRMRSENIDENDEAAVAAFLASDLFNNREMYELKEADLMQYPIDDIRGIYRIGEVYTIAVIPNKTPFRDYIGVILESSSKIWKRGQVKLEIRQVDENQYHAFSYLRNHSLRFSGRYKLKNGILGDSWVKTSKVDDRNYSSNDDRSFHFSMLNDTTAYLRIHSFSGYHSAAVDSLFSVADEKIRRTPYLIVDVRDNGGGSDRNVNPLLPYIYTNPIKGDRVELLVTEDNLNLWKSWQKDWESDRDNYSKDQIRWIKEEVRRMEKAENNSWILRSEAGEFESDDVSEYPTSVAIIQNQYCASSCETLLFWAKQSSKTILVGENSGGYVGYGENGGLNTPCYNFGLTCTMTRYQEQRKYEAEGIAPDYSLDYDRDWITQALELLGEK